MSTEEKTKTFGVAEIRCPACYISIYPMPGMKEVDYHIMAEELNLTVEEVKMAILSELTDGHPFTCERCETVFTPADQGPVAS